MRTRAARYTFDRSSFVRVVACGVLGLPLALSGCARRRARARVPPWQAVDPSFRGCQGG